MCQITLTVFCSFLENFPDSKQRVAHPSLTWVSTDFFLRLLLTRCISEWSALPRKLSGLYGNNIIISSSRSFVVFPQAVFSAISCFHNLVSLLRHRRVAKFPPRVLCNGSTHPRYAHIRSLEAELQQNRFLHLERDFPQLAQKFGALSPPTLKSI